jgi:hypothetical protein
VSDRRFIHCEALTAKELGEILTNAVEIVNFIKTSSVMSRVSEILCLEMGSEHSHLSLHAEIRWMSRGRVLRMLFELRREVHAFF